MNRRDFLGWTAGGAAGLLLPSVIRPAPKVFDMGRGRGCYRPDPAIVAEQRRGAFRTVRDGDWTDPTTWGGALVPHRRADVRVDHPVPISGDVSECLIRLGPGYDDGATIHWRRRISQIVGNFVIDERMGPNDRMGGTQFVTGRPIRNPLSAGSLSPDVRLLCRDTVAVMYGNVMAGRLHARQAEFWLEAIRRRS